MNKYLEKALWTLLFDKNIKHDDDFIYTNPITMDEVSLSYNDLFNGKYSYDDAYIGLMLAYPNNITKVKMDKS